MALTLDLPTGLTGSAELVVGEQHTAPRIGSGRIRVLATPVMINLIEAAALAAGLHEAAHARLVGAASAGLRGELRSVMLPGSHIVLRFPAERALLLDGTPREALRPEIAVDLAAPSGGPGDPILYQGLKAFENGR